MSKAVIPVAIIIVTLISASGVLADENMLTGLPITAETAPHPIPTRTDMTEVLWDVTHGVYFNYSPGGWFAPLVAQLVDYNISVTDAGIHTIYLSDYDILVICVGSAWTLPYTPEDLNEVDNSAFADNTFDWLRDCGGATPIEPTTWGLIKGVFVR
jgi:hypothetical protein